MEFFISLIVALIILLLILPIGITIGKIVDAVYWAENEKRKHHKETDETR